MRKNDAASEWHISVRTGCDSRRVYWWRSTVMEDEILTLGVFFFLYLNGFPNFAFWLTAWILLFHLAKHQHMREKPSDSLLMRHENSCLPFLDWIDEEGGQLDLALWFAFLDRCQSHSYFNMRVLGFLYRTGAFSVFVEQTVEEVICFRWQLCDTLLDIFLNIDLFEMQRNKRNCLFHCGITV